MCVESLGESIPSAVCLFSLEEVLLSTIGEVVEQLTERKSRRSFVFVNIPEQLIRGQCRDRHYCFVKCETRDSSEFVKWKVERRHVGANTLLGIIPLRLCYFAANQAPASPR